MSNLVFLGVFLFLFPLIHLLISGIFWRIPYAKRTTGEIIGMVYSHTSLSSNFDGLSRSCRMYKAHVEYEVEGKKYVLVSRYTSNRFRVGKKVRVVYNETNPQMSKFYNCSFVWLAFAFVSIALVILGLFGVSIGTIKAWIDSILSTPTAENITLVFVPVLSVFIVVPVVWGFVLAVVRGVKKIRRSTKARDATPPAGQLQASCSIE